ncbi:uncharacterized protein LOC128246181 [Mya arenaria]|uniref:uncharacterized protein LOC128246181 n=1 Tax=Mya arenaria TaxID=6604 RepID=UPI0022E9081C|nr:uncharacterized protein LOC128246181 [Mya arenaria]
MKTGQDRFVVPEVNFGQFVIDRMKRFGDTVALVDPVSERQLTYKQSASRIEQIAAGLYSLGFRQGDNSATVSIARQTFLEKLIVLGKECDGYVDFDSLLKHGTLQEKPEVDPKMSTALLLSSSGTTGLPKFVRLTHRNLVANMIQIQDNQQLRSGDVVVLALPAFHHFGLVGALGVGLCHGVKLVHMERWHTSSYFKNIQKYKANIIHVVPAMAASIVKFPDRLKYDVSSVRYIVAAAAPMGVNVETQLRDLFKLDFVAMSYGLSETGHNSGNSVLYHRFGSNGKPPIVNSETEEELSRNKTGEIRVRGPMVSHGYLDDEDATRNALDLKGYFKTGDLGYLDADGYLFIVDRLKELIKYKGLQVAPAYLEDIIVKHPDVVDAAVIGIPDPDAGELPRAYVVRQPGSQTTTKDIIQYVHDHVAPHMRLRGGVEFIEEVPRTPSGKIMRRLLKTRKQCLSKL